jgi:hypothetical protein
MKNGLESGFVVGSARRAVGEPRHGGRGAIIGIAVLFCAGLSAGWGPAPDAQKPLPPGVTPPARLTALVELTVPAGVRLALEGTKLTENRTKGEVITEGESTLRLSNHILLRAHGARVTVSSPVRHRESRVVIEPMPATVAEK